MKIPSQVTGVKGSCPLGLADPIFACGDRPTIGDLLKAPMVINMQFWEIHGNTWKYHIFGQSQVLYCGCYSLYIYTYMCVYIYIHTITSPLCLVITPHVCWLNPLHRQLQIKISENLYIIKTNHIVKIPCIKARYPGTSTIRRRFLSITARFSRTPQQPTCQNLVEQPTKCEFTPQSTSAVGQ